MMADNGPEEDETIDHIQCTDDDTKEVDNTGWCPDSSQEEEEAGRPLVFADEDHRFLDRQEVCFLWTSLLKIDKVNIELSKSFSYLEKEQLCSEAEGHTAEIVVGMDLGLGNDCN